MLAELAQFAAGWPLVLSLALVITGQGLLAGRRRMVLNEALHELRRPLQALSLALPAAAAPEGEELTRQAATALVRLEREVNGETIVAAQEPVAVASLLAAAVARWAGLARRAGTSLTLCGGGAGASVRGDRDGIERALDNLIVNAVEHGGPQVGVAAEAAGPRLRIVVRDSGTARGGERDRRSGANAPLRLAAALSRLSGRRRRGHGLRLVRRVAAAHGGELRLRRRGNATEAVLELPLATATAAAEAEEWA